MTSLQSNTATTTTTYPAIQPPIDPENSAIYQAIISAIESRCIVKLRYEGDSLTRTFSPYIFRLAKNGNYVISGMQNSNPNGLDEDNQRRTFSLSKIQINGTDGPAFYASRYI